MKKFLLAVLILFFFIVLPTTSHALLLADVPYSLIFTHFDVKGDSFSTKVYYASGGPVAFDFPSLTSANSGEIYTITAPDTNFNDFSNLLTDGSDQTLAFELRALTDGATVTFFSAESVRFSGNPYSYNAIDFKDNEITSLQLALDSITYQLLPNDGGTQGSISARFIINGNPSAVIPEPSTLFLLGAGLTGAFLRKRKK